MDVFWEVLMTDPTLAVIYQVVRALVILLDIALIFIIIYALRELLRYRPKFVWDPTKWQKHVKTKKKKVQLQNPVTLNAWKKVESKLKDGSADSLRLAIVEADGVVDEVLKRMNLGGETFADRLSHLSAEKYPSLERLWDAHRVRNNLVHTPDFEISAMEAEETIAAYEAFLKEVKAI